jgi:hypothetical protein
MANNTIKVYSLDRETLHQICCSVFTQLRHFKLEAYITRERNCKGEYAAAIRTRSPEKVSVRERLMVVVMTTSWNVCEKLDTDATIPMT